MFVQRGEACWYAVFAHLQNQAVHFTVHCLKDDSPHISAELTDKEGSKLHA